MKYIYINWYVVLHKSKYYLLDNFTPDWLVKFYFPRLAGQ